MRGCGGQRKERSDAQSPTNEYRDEEFFNKILAHGTRVP